MTIGSILFGVSILILVGLFVGRPLMFPKVELSEHQSERLTLLKQKATLLESIQSLDFDHETGKIPTDVYESQRVQLVKDAATVIQQLETAPTSPTGKSRTRGQAVSHSNGSSDESILDLDAKIEAAISRVRVGAAAPTNLTATKNASAKGQFCSQCGSSLDADDIFCSSCGHKLSN